MTSEKDEILTELLRKASNHQMTPCERWEQRVSFAFGQLMDTTSGVTYKDMEKRATEMYGSKPDDNPKILIDPLATQVKKFGQRLGYSAAYGIPFDDEFEERLTKLFKGPGGKDLRARCKMILHGFNYSGGMRISTMAVQGRIGVEQT